MKKRVFLIVICIFFMTVILTGCTANINITSNEKKSENNNTSTEEEFKINEDEESVDMYLDEKYSSSYIDLGDKGYSIIYGLDDNQNVTWTYETKIVDAEKYMNYITLCNDDELYVVDGETLLALDMKNGNVLWRLENENITQLDYCVREDGIIDLFFGEDTKIFMSVDPKGNVLNRLDLSKYNTTNKEVYWFDYFEETKLIVIASDSTTEDYRSEFKLTIDIETAEVTVENYEYNDVTADLLVGKTISNGYYESYFFNSDGSVVIGREDPYGKFSVIRYHGTWTLENGILKIKVNEAIIANNGSYEINQDGESILVNYDEKSVTTDFEKEMPIYYCPNYEGAPKIYLDGEYYSFLEAVG